ncbi:MAG: alpha/beta hydrolase fold domain-containing protein [Verrucomicrobia bacterium]|nr:alpha/beta hydrolase fold domain-containing protein [Verrucomicrobiota bacterium]
MRTICFTSATAGVLLLLSSGLAAGPLEATRTVAQRIEVQHLRAVHEERARLAAARSVIPGFAVYDDFRAVMHVHAEDSDHTKGTREQVLEASIRESLRGGHVYVSHDWLCDPTGFAFGAVNNLGVFTMGDTVPFAGRTRILAVTPVASKLRLFHNGSVVTESTGTNLTYQAASPGTYRIEARLEIDGETRPWIYSNPVYLKIPSPDFMKLPSREIAPEVEAKRDLVYAEGQTADEEKHKRDLYIPIGKTGMPVFFFIHGGAWRSGDRSQYPAVGNRFAKEGILTVVPSYRLAPKHPHPAQIEDVSEAFNWVVRRISDFGGDTNRIFVGGHSAGGHLAALLTLNEHYLDRLGLSPSLITDAFEERISAFRIGIGFHRS